MYAYDELDRTLINERVEEFRDQVKRRLSGELTEDEFTVRYPLKPNHLNPSAGWALGDAGGCLFDTYGIEIAFGKRQDPLMVWTLVDSGDGDMYLVNGLHSVNRVGYLLSTVPVPKNVTVLVRQPMSKNEDHDQAKATSN